MNLQISIIGIGLIAVFYAILVAILVPLWRWLSPAWLKWSVTVPLALLLLALPVADEVWITWHFNELCKDAGVHVTRKVDVEGYLNDTSRASPDYAKEFVITDASAIREFDRAGYRFKESLFSDGRVRHLERVPEGIRITILDRPAARYVYKHAYQPTPHKTEEPVGFRIGKREIIIVDSQTGETIGRETGFNRYPGWIDWLWIRFLGNGMTQCPDAGQGPPREHLPSAVLNPMKNK